MISVCMASYNGELWIREQIESILIQLDQSDELIISDDGSTDSTINIIRAFNDPRIHLLTFDKKVGPSGNFERALNSSTGDLIFLADQDDIWLDGKVETLVKALETTFLVMHDAKLIDETGKIISESYFKTRKVVHGVIKNMLKNSYTGAFMAFRRELLEIALPIPSRIHHDQWIALMAEFLGKPQFAHESFALWRRHSDTVTSLSTKKWQTFLNIIPSRIKIIREFKKRIAEIDQPLSLFPDKHGET